MGYIPIYSTLWGQVLQYHFSYFLKFPTHLLKDSNENKEMPYIIII